MEMAVLKSVAGFLNAKGGTLILGVADDGTPISVEKDGFAGEGKMSLHLINLLKDRLAEGSPRGQHAMNVQSRFDDNDSVRVLVIECSRSPSPVFVKDTPIEKFFVRYGPSTPGASRRNRA